MMPRKTVCDSFLVASTATAPGHQGVQVLEKVDMQGTAKAQVLLAIVSALPATFVQVQIAN
jgi:hypothetical protein